jgi:hypothetical protein
MHSIGNASFVNIQIPVKKLKDLYLQLFSRMILNINIYENFQNVFLMVCIEYSFP